MSIKKKDRLLKAYEHLRNLGIVHTQNDVSNAMKANKTNVSYAFNGNEKYLTDKFLNRFNKAFNDIFEIDWLLTGEGEMLKPMDDSQSEEQMKIDFSALIRINEKTAEAVQSIANSNEKMAELNKLLAETNVEMWQSIKAQLNKIEELLEKKGGNAQGIPRVV